MRIIAISDSHGQLHNIPPCTELLKSADYIFHLGDHASDSVRISKYIGKEIIAVRGNCDYGEKYEDEVVVSVGEINCFLTHGHAYGVKRNRQRLYYRALELECKIAFYGHSHIACVEHIGDVWIINPGSPSLPRDGQQPGVAVIDIDESTGKISPAIVSI